MELEKPTPYEQGWLRILDALRDNPAVDVMNEVRLDIDLTAEDTAFDELAEWEGVEIDADLRAAYIRFAQLGVQWRTVAPCPELTGEFHLTPLPLAVHEDPPEFTSPLFSDERRLLADKLRVIDDSPFTGTGSFTALRLQPGVGNPEVWFSDHRTNSLWLMDVDYCAYMDALRLTKGVFDWQHLFTDAPLDDDEFTGTAADLRAMLDVLPELFPTHDYTDLRARLEARL
ncbi:hypothetical protein ABZY20_27100 [Streptomyces sp. NPDC006624]|uniref:hypothetical protein n=1 Tax=Streptomyces sp. NPDC006624 TaxID=3154892 RepID=UPI00339FA926